MTKPQTPTSQAHEAGPEGVEWETLTLGLGDAWDFEHYGPMTGHFLGTTTRDVEDKKTHEIRPTNVHQFAEYADPDRVVFIWGSTQLDDAFASDLIRQGDLVQIIFLGIDQFTDKETGEPRVIKRYKVRLAKRPQA